MRVEWVAVVPVKALATAKSRLAPLPAARRRALAAAFAVDTVQAVRAAGLVRAVVVVCGDPDLSLALSGGRVQVLDEPEPPGLNRAARAGIAHAGAAHPDAGVLVVQADLPTLRSDDVDEVLRRAGRHPRAAVADRDGTGTTMLTGLPGVPPRPLFGVGSLARHLADGAVLLDTVDLARAGRDVDTDRHLAEARRLGVGPATRRALRKG